MKSKYYKEIKNSSAYFLRTDALQEANNYRNEVKLFDGWETQACRQADVLSSSPLLLQLQLMAFFYVF